MTLVKRIVVLGGGFGGLTTVRELERLSVNRTAVEITLVNRDNFFVMSPLLFEAWLTGAADWLPRRRTYAYR